MNVAKSWTYFITNAQPVEKLTLNRAAELLAKARREAAAEEKVGLPAGKDWHGNLEAKLATEASTTIGKQIVAFVRALQGGRLHDAMGTLLKLQKETLPSSRQTWRTTWRTSSSVGVT